MSWLKELLFRKIFLNIIIEWLDKLFQHLGKDGAKTLTGALVAGIALIIKLLPETAPYAQPLLDHLKSLPYDTILVGGVAYSTFIGYGHKVVKWLKAKLSVEERLDINVNPETPVTSK